MRFSGFGETGSRDASSDGRFVEECRATADCRGSAQSRYVDDTVGDIKRLGKVAGKMLDNAEFKVEGDRVDISMNSELSPAEVASIAKSLLPSVEEARQKAREVQSTNNIKQLALAMMIYVSDHKTFPPAFDYVYEKNGQKLKSNVPHSWRIDLLPYLEQQNLYNQYQFDEPWDSDANKKVLAQMPAVFRSPLDANNSTNTSYFVLTGPDTIFPDETPTPMRQIRDGTSNTILLVEAKRSIPWTKPEDIPYAADKPLPKLGGWIPGEFLTAFADGSVRSISATVDENCCGRTSRKPAASAPARCRRPVPVPRNQPAAADRTMLC